MKLKNLFMLMSFLAMLFSCDGSQADKELFYGEIRYVNDKDVVSKDVTARHVSLDGIYTGTIAAYDSLLLCWDTSYPGHFINLFNVDTGKEIGYFCPKGGGPNELFNTNPVYQFFKKGDDVMALFDGNSQALAIWNLTKSVQTGKTVYDTIVHDYKGLGLFFFRLPDDALINVVSSQHKTMHEMTTPYCERRPLYTAGETQKFPLYKVESVNVGSSSSFFNSWSALKPDGTKLVQAMGYLPQLNIVDTRTGQVVAYRMKGGPDYSLLQSEVGNLTKYYLSVQADDKYIYAAYWGKELWRGASGEPMPKFDQIHVLDWEGNLLYKLKTDQSFFIIWLDTVRNRLYTRDWGTDEIYYLDLNELSL